VRASSELVTPDRRLRSATSLSDLPRYKRFSASTRIKEAHRIRSLPPHIIALHVDTLHGYSSSSCCRARTRLGLAASQIPPRPFLPRYCCAQPRCPSCESVPSCHASPPPAHVRTARVLGPYRAAALTSETASALHCSLWAVHLRSSPAPALARLHRLHRARHLATEPRCATTSACPTPALVSNARSPLWRLPCSRAFFCAASRHAIASASLEPSCTGSPPRSTALLAQLGPARACIPGSRSRHLRVAHACCPRVLHTPPSSACLCLCRSTPVLCQLPDAARLVRQHRAVRPARPRRLAQLQPRPPLQLACALAAPAPASSSRWRPLPSARARACARRPGSRARHTSAQSARAGSAP
jgi:hypothetical protein